MLFRRPFVAERPCTTVVTFPGIQTKGCCHFRCAKNQNHYYQLSLLIDLHHVPAAIIVEGALPLRAGMVFVAVEPKPLFFPHASPPFIPTPISNPSPAQVLCTGVTQCCSDPIQSQWRRSRIYNSRIFCGMNEFVLQVCWGDEESSIINLVNNSAPRIAKGVNYKLNNIAANSIATTS